MSLFLVDSFPGDFQEGKRPSKLRKQSGPLRTENGPLPRGKAPLRLMGCFQAPPRWWGPSKRSIKRSMNKTAVSQAQTRIGQKKHAATRNTHSLVVATLFGGLPALESLAICDFRVAAILATKRGRQTWPVVSAPGSSGGNLLVTLPLKLS